MMIMGCVNLRELAAENGIRGITSLHFSVLLVHRKGQAIIRAKFITRETV